MKTIDEILLSVEKPSRYIGGEFGEKTLSLSKFNYCICFPDVYEVAMSNLGIRIVAEVINRIDNACCDRCFAPWVDFGSLLKENNIPLYSLGLKKPLKEFDMLGFSLQYEMSYTTILYMLELANIPLNREDRDDSYPIIQGGGPCAFNPEPLAQFFDIFVIGDGEDSMRELALLKLQTSSKKEFLEKATNIKGVYVPSLTYPVYENGKIVRFEGKKVEKAFCLDLENAVCPDIQAVANIEAVHDRAVIEIMRGCYRGCRFCQAGFIYRPVRHKSVEKLTQLGCSIVNKCGFDTLSMNSLSSSDYPYLKQLITSLSENLPAYSTLALPSLRIDNFDEFYVEKAKKNSLTFAPEGGTQRLRDVINKDITDEDILNGIKKAFNMGYNGIKLYFMMGLPTETDEDVEGIVNIVNLVKSVYSENPKRYRALKINVSVSTFIPKPFTPFCFEEFSSREQIERKIDLLKKGLYIKGVTFNWNDYNLSMIEAILARGGRDVGDVLLSAYKKGCYFDSWNEYFKYDLYEQAIKETHYDLSSSLGEQDENSILPWDFIDIGITKNFFLSERHKAYNEKCTGGCQTGCKGCGLMGRCNIK